MAAQARFRSLGGRRRCDAKMRVELLDRTAGAKTMHAYKDTVGADQMVPTLSHAGLYSDLDRRLADRLRAVFRALLFEELETGDRNDARRMTAVLQHLSCSKRDLNLGACGENRHRGLTLCRGQFIGSVSAQIILDKLGPHR